MSSEKYKKCNACGKKTKSKNLELIKGIKIRGEEQRACAACIAKYGRD
jgi:hypothetical protein